MRAAWEWTSFQSLGIGGPSWPKRVVRGQGLSACLLLPLGTPTRGQQAQFWLEGLSSCLMGHLIHKECDCCSSEGECRLP